MTTAPEPEQNATHTEPIEQLKQRLISKHLGRDRLIELEDGEKRSTVKHTEPSNRYDADQLSVTARGTTQNYGVYAGDRLLLIDIDDYDGVARPNSIDALPETFTTQTPHGGEHRYYKIDRSLRETLEARYGSRNPQPDWGEIRSHHQYVVGPGSQLNGCNKDCTDCADEDKGWYRIIRDSEIAELSERTLLSVLDEELEYDGRDERVEDEEEGGAVDYSDNETDHDYPEDYDPVADWYDVDDWIDDKALPADETLENLWSGNYAAEGYGEDRSEAEYRLAARLAFWLGPNKGRVRRQMERAAPKKWTERADSYHESILKAVDAQNEFYSGPKEQASDPEFINTSPNAQVSREEARDRTFSAIKKAFKRGDTRLIEALPTLGKSYGAARAAAQTGLPTTILTQRHDLYNEVEEWCAEYGLTVHQLPAMTDRCPTYTENPETPAERRLLDAYERGATPREIHESLDNLPCQQGEGCPCLSAWNFEIEEYDVLVGHYTQANVDPLIEGRVVVIDECPNGVFDTTIDDTLPRSISEFLVNEKDTNPNLPDSTPTSYLELGKLDPNSKVGQALRSEIEMAVEERDNWRSGKRSTQLATDTHSRAHRRGPEAVYAVLCGGSKVNGYERILMSDGTVLLHNPENAAVHIRDPPSFEDAHSVVCLDGTPTRRLWESSLGLSFGEDGHETILDTEERQSYIRDVQEWEFVQTTDEFVYNYTRHENVNVEKSAALVEAIRQKHEREVSIISTKACIDRFSSEGVFDGELSSKHYGSLKSSNEFSDHSLGLVLGTRHFPREWVYREAAFENEEIDIEDDGIEKSYGSEYGDALLTHMREHEVLQAAMRFRRSEETEALVYVHTACLPDWVPRELRNVEIKRLNGSSRESVLGVLNDTQPPWTVSELHEDGRIEVSERQVRNALLDFCEAGVLECDKTDRPHEYYGRDLDSVNPYGIVSNL